MDAHTHLNTHEHKYQTPDIYTHVLKNQQTRKNEAMSREQAVMCRKTQEFVNNEVNMQSLEESRPEISPMNKPPQPCNYSKQQER
jgi:hypothetical protein